MIQRILVLGGGSAGFLAAITLKRKLPKLDVKIIRSEKIGIVGVGEGTTFTIPNYLHGYLDIDPKKFHRAVGPTYKLGIRFLWGPRPYFHYTFTNQLSSRYRRLPKANGFYCDEELDYADMTSALMAHDRVFEHQGDGGALVRHNVAYHLENKRFVSFLEQAAELAGIVIQDDTVEHVERNEEGVTALQLASGRKESADLYVDCSGFRAELISSVFQEPFIGFRSSLFCDRAVVGGWTRTGEPLKPYTTAETMDSGWSWQIEHEELINRGYVYCSDFISDEDAEKEFRAKNPKVDQTRVVKFVSGRYRNAWVKNVVALGNAAGFVEPLESTSLAIICEQAAALTKTLLESDFELRTQQTAYYNQFNAGMWDAVRRFLAIHYKFNTRCETPFWRACREDTDICDAEPIIAYYQECGPSLLWSKLVLDAADPFGWEGYLAMFVGQSVPYRHKYLPGPEERERWQRIKRRLKIRALAAVPQEKALSIIRSDAWSWRPDFYKAAVRW